MEEENTVANSHETVVSITPNIKGRESNGRFAPGNPGGPKRSVSTKARITRRMLDKFDASLDKGGASPVDLWKSILDGTWQGLEELSAKDVITFQLKAADSLAKYVYDASFQTEEAETTKMTPEQLEVLRGYFKKAQ